MREIKNLAVCLVLALILCAGIYYIYDFSTSVLYFHKYEPMVEETIKNNILDKCLREVKP